MYTLIASKGLITYLNEKDNINNVLQKQNKYLPTPQICSREQPARISIIDRQPLAGRQAVRA